MNSDDLFDALIEYDKFVFYMPVWTVGTAKTPAERHPVFDPDKHCKVLPFGHTKHEAFFPMFTDEHLAESAVEYIVANGQPNSYVMRINDHRHFAALLDFYQRAGVNYVGTDFNFVPRQCGQFRPIANIINACRSPESLRED
jgi:hypothetical protein